MADSYDIKVTTQGEPKPVLQVAAALDKTADATKRVDEVSTQATESTRRQAAATKGAGEASARAAEDTKKQGEATKEASEGARSLADDLTSLGSRNNATKDVVEGLDAALKGNAASFFGVAKAATNLVEIFTVSTPLGRALQLALIGLNTAALLIPKSTEEAAKGIDETGDAAAETKPKIDALAAAFEKAGAAKLKEFTAEMTAVKDAAKGAGDELERIMKLREQLEKPSEQDRASIENNPNLSDAEKNAKLYALEQGEVNAARNREALNRGQRFMSADDDLKSARAAQRKIEDERDGFSQSIEQAKKESEARRARLQRAEVERKNLDETTARRFSEAERPFTPEESSAIMDDYRKRKRGIDDEVESAKKAIADNDPGQARFVAEQVRRVEQLNKAIEEAAQLVTALEKQFTSIGKTVGGIGPGGLAIFPGEEGSVFSREDAERRKKYGIVSPQGESGKRTIDPAKEGSVSFAPVLKDYDALARALITPEKNYDSLENAFRGIGDAVRERARAEQERIDAMARDLEEVKNQIKNR